MVASRDSSAPRVAIIGITGKQGGSVADALLASSKPYRLVGITRSVTKPASKEWEKKGIEMKEVTIAVGNEDQLRAAFKGVDIVFSTTDFWAHFDKEREIAEGKLVVDQAKAVGAKLFIWSTLESLSDATNGKYPVPFFDTKDAIAKYVKSSGVPYSLVRCAFYFANFMPGGLSAPKKQPDGTYVLSVPVSPDLKLVVLDCPIDFGLYVREVIENPKLGAGSEVVTGSLVSFNEAVAALSKASGKKVVCRQLSKDEFLEDASNFGPAAEWIYNMYMAFTEVGSTGPLDLVENQRNAGIKPRTFDEIVQSWTGPLLSDE